MKRKRHAYLVLATFLGFGNIGIAVGSSLALTSSASQCPSRTVNYITHTLPQQCLRTNWNDTRLTSSGEETISKPPSIISVFDTETTVTEHLASSTISSANDSHLAVDVSQPTTSFSTPTPISTATEVVVSSTNLDLELGSDGDSDAALDNSQFLSFEEWKKQKIEERGQVVRDEKEAKLKQLALKKKQAENDQALDALGDDVEIDIDFGLLTGHYDEDRGPSSSEIAPEDSRATDVNPVVPPIRQLPKDAGRTCKERSNFASFDCAATIMKTNVGSKGASAILKDNKDAYMLNECSEKNKFFIVELCTDILIDTIVLANHEFFSSMFRNFRVSVSDKYPVKQDKWRVLGEYEARNSREVQAFLVEDPKLFAKYVRVELLTHYGNEYYCPITLFKVHGTSMMDDYKNEVDSSADDGDEDGHSGEDTAVNQPESIVIPPAPDINKSLNDLEDKDETLENATVDIETIDGDICDDFDLSELDPGLLLLFNWTSISTCDGNDEKSSETARAAVSQSPETIASSSTPVKAPVSENSTSTTSMSGNESDIADVTGTPPKNPSSSQSTVHQGSEKTGQTSVETRSSSTPSYQQAGASTHEGFFKTVQRRLQLLETNATLSLRYIEEQSKMLRDAFSKVDKKQMQKTNTFLEYLNGTVLGELKGFRQQYDQLWQSTVLELETQREQSQREVLAISARLSLLADELVFQKRMSIVQSMLLLLCLGLVLFSRSSQLELPLLQTVMAKSAIALPFESPPTSPPDTRPVSRHHTYKVLESSLSRGTHPDNDYSTDAGGKSSPNSPLIDDEHDHDVDFDTLAESSVIPSQSQSGPSTPSGRRAGLLRNLHNPSPESWSPENHARPTSHITRLRDEDNVSLRSASPLSLNTQTTSDPSSNIAGSSGANSATALKTPTASKFGKHPSKASIDEKSRPTSPISINSPYKHLRTESAASRVSFESDTGSQPELDNGEGWTEQKPRRRRGTNSHAHVAKPRREATALF
jgi:hypothetical protein